MSYNPFSLVGKNILVTGASSGIGRTTAIECSKLGANIIITGRNEDRLNETLSLLEPGNHISITCDLTDEKELSDLISKLTVIDGLVLTAGIVTMKPFTFISTKAFESIYSTNLFSPIELLRQIVKKKKAVKGLSVVGISSVAGREDFIAANGIYGSGKAAFSSLLKYAALELASKGIRVNTVSPGMIMTPMHSQGQLSEDDLKKVEDRIPLSRWGEPQDVAYACCYLLSDASSYLTGSDIKVDGGLTI
ncbi:MAG: SDR family oxidoreductase [Roseburia sp.]|nr:SDR family oxidoreductase [Muribaculum sp.]MCM1440121.1 SDR family oxidoreductase [Roseburia sp.]